MLTLVRFFAGPAIRRERCRQIVQWMRENPGWHFTKELSVPLGVPTLSLTHLMIELAEAGYLRQRQSLTDPFRRSEYEATGRIYGRGVRDGTSDTTARA